MQKGRLGYRHRSRWWHPNIQIPYYPTESIKAGFNFRIFETHINIAPTESGIVEYEESTPTFTWRGTCHYLGEAYPYIVVWGFDYSVGYNKMAFRVDDPLGDFTTWAMKPRVFTQFTAAASVDWTSLEIVHLSALWTAVDYPDIRGVQYH